MIGQTIGHYKILEKIGEGGMGVVYKAEDTSLQRVVALKFLPARGGESETDKARFLQEARAAAALNHPNICTIYGIEEHEGFIAMEFVDGETLHEKRATLTPAKAVEIGIQVAEGLAAAHEKGVVHRDIKPDNIMVRKDGLVQIMDFGLAKLRASTMSRLTREGSTVGTAGYMSPEQVQGQDADHRSDIFSLGVLLYELFTGELPFKGVHETALMYEIVNVDPAPMSAVKAGIDPELDRIVLECLQKEPDERYNAVKDVAKDLKRFKRESSRQRMSRVTAARPAIGTGERPAGLTTAGRSKPGLSKSGMIGYALAGLLAIALVAVILLRRDAGPSATPVLRFMMDLPPDAPLTAVVSGIAVSSDGRYLAYRTAGPNGNQIFMRRMDDTVFRPVPGTEGANDPTFSPDGKWLAFRAPGVRLLRLSISGGAPEVLCRLPGETRGIHWGRDASIYFGVVNDGIYRVPETGGTPEPATKLDSAAGEISHRFPDLLPDGKTLVFTVKKHDLTTFDDALIVSESVGGGDRKTLVRGGTYPKHIPTGHLMYVRGNSILAVPFDADRVEVTGQAVEVGHGGWMIGGAGTACVDFSDNGLLVYAPSGALNTNAQSLAWVDRAAKVTALFDTLRPYSWATLSPDGRKIALGINAANNDVWVYNIPRNLLSRVTFGGGNNDFAIWSPDGNYVVYSSEKGKTRNIFRKPWDGTGKEERLTTGAGPQVAESFTPDGKTLVYSGGGDIQAVPIDEAGAPGEPRKLLGTQAREGGGIISPDGRWLAYLSDESGKMELFVTSFPKCEGKWQISNGGAGGHLWSRDGKELLFFAGTALMTVEVRVGVTFDFSMPRKVFEIPSGVLVDDISPDGKKFLARIGTPEQFRLTRFGVVSGWFTDVISKFEGGRQ